MLFYISCFHPALYPRSLSKFARARWISRGNWPYFQQHLSAVVARDRLLIYKLSSALVSSTDQAEPAISRPSQSINQSRGGLNNAH